MKRDAWLAAHPYLKPVADLQALLDVIAAEISIPEAPVPKFDEYIVDYQAGVPLLQSKRVALDLFPAEETLDSFLTKLGASNLPGNCPNSVAACKPNCGTIEIRRGNLWLDVSKETPRLLHIQDYYAIWAGLHWQFICARS
jgi:hypothetical protein